MLGKGKGTRAFAHFRNYSDTRLSRVLKKRARDGIKIAPEIIPCESEELAFFVEEELIRKFGREDLNEGTLFNLTNGGDGASGSKTNGAKKGVKRKPFTEEHKLRISIGASVKRGPPPQTICPHCGKSGGTNNMKRWHFDNCKQNSIRQHMELI